jgi:hypothetical protein
MEIPFIPAHGDSDAATVEVHAVSINTLICAPLFRFAKQLPGVEPRALSLFPYGPF